MPPRDRASPFLLFPLPAVVLVVATSLAGRPGILLPAWLARAGLPLAVVMVAGAWFGMPQVSFALFGFWLTFVAVVLLRHSRGLSTRAEYGGLTR